MIVVTTLPHYLSSIPIRKNYTYRNIILLSSSFSVLYHTYNNKVITILDYFMAGVWFLYDMRMGAKYKVYTTIFYLNALIFLINISITSSSAHSIWHLLSATKCFYISSLLEKIEKNNPHTHVKMSTLSSEAVCDNACDVCGKDYDETQYVGCCRDGRCPYMREFLCTKCGIYDEKLGCILCVACFENYDKVVAEDKEYAASQ